MTLTLSSNSGSSWNLAAGIAEQAQGLVTSGFGDLRAACALILSADAPGGAWLAALRGVAPITPADGPRTPSIAIAFTSLGLAQAGVPDALLREFSLPFYEGMMQKDRRRSLGDAGEDDAPLATIEWGLRPEPAPDGTDAQPEGTATPEPAPTIATSKTTKPIHALLLLYHTSHADLLALLKTVEPVLDAKKVQILRRVALDLNPDKNAPDVREHFGFVDGISQPIPYGPGTKGANGRERERDPLHGVALGDILLGYPDAHETPSSGPFMVGTTKDGKFVPTTALPLDAAVAAMEEPASQQLRDLGLNGSYLVVRELRQHVDEFWASMQTAANDLNAASPGKPPVDARWIAERVIGRSKDGDMLRPGGHLSGAGGCPDNDFLFFREDRHGYGCPMGSHVRRANPRDGLAYNAGVCEDLLHSANAHRILRRGRKFGGGVGGSDADDDTQGKGLLFMCLNGDIARQFEFVQQNWMLNPNFATLYNEVDPLLGPESDLTLPAQPLRRRIRVATFVTLVGGDYFFLPSIATLDILQALPGIQPSSKLAQQSHQTQVQRA